MLTKLKGVHEYVDLTTITSMGLDFPRQGDGPAWRGVIIRHGTHGMFDALSIIVPFDDSREAETYLRQLAVQANAESIEQANRPTVNARCVRDVLLEIVREFAQAGLLPKE